MASSFGCGHGPGAPCFRLAGARGARNSRCELGPGRLRDLLERRPPPQTQGIRRVLRLRGARFRTPHPGFSSRGSHGRFVAPAPGDLGPAPGRQRGDAEPGAATAARDFPAHTDAALDRRGAPGRQRPSLVRRRRVLRASRGLPIGRVASDLAADAPVRLAVADRDRGPRLLQEISFAASAPGLPLRADLLALRPRGDRAIRPRARRRAGPAATLPLPPVPSRRDGSGALSRDRPLEKRLLIAAGLSLVVLLAWEWLVPKPPKPPRTAATTPSAAASATPAPGQTQAQTRRSGRRRVRRLGSPSAP